MHGSGGKDNIDGGTGHDRIYGGNGNDILRGGTGVDLISGDGGDDIFVLDAPTGRQTEIYADTDLIRDFSRSTGNMDKIRVDLSDPDPNAEEPRFKYVHRLLDELDLFAIPSVLPRHESYMSTFQSIHPRNVLFNNSRKTDIQIWYANDTHSPYDDVLVMVLVDVDFSVMTLDMFDII